MTQSHIDELDGLRGLAALIVVVSHGANAGLLPGVLGQGFGQQGVALFYVLSGFLMARLYLPRPPDRAALGAYAAARIARVLPLFYAVLLASAALLLAAGPDIYQIGGAQGFAAHALLVQGSGRVLWSVPLEMQFYVLFALLWWAAGRGWLAWGLAGLVLLQIAALALTFAVSAALSREVNVHALPFWLHFFTCGIAAALLRPRHVPGWLVAGALLLAPLMLPEARRALGWWVGPNFADPVTAGAPVLLFVLVLWRRDLFGVLARPPLRFLGRISFGIYLLHYPLLLAVPALGLDGLAGFAVVALLSVAVAAASFHGFEAPLQRHLRTRALPRR